MRFDRVLQPAKPIVASFKPKDIRDAVVHAEFLSVSEQEVVLAFVTAAEQNACWVGLERSLIETRADNLRWGRVGRIVLNRLLVVLTLGLVPRFWNGTLNLVDELTADIPQRVHDAVMALHDRNCVTIHGHTVCPTSALVYRLAHARERGP
ncbi:hypothetical protein EBS80_00540 [bacterium]|nr:hypothetical protein [bacterium]